MLFRSLARYISGVDRYRKSDGSILDLWRWLTQDYLLAQHTIIALEKWQQRKVNTFHFYYEQGVFEWVSDDSTGFSASRFRQASDMLRDLGLYQVDEEGVPFLTDKGRETLARVKEACRD